MVPFAHEVGKLKEKIDTLFVSKYCIVKYKFLLLYWLLLVTILNSLYLL